MGGARGVRGCSDVDCDWRCMKRELRTWPVFVDILMLRSPVQRRDTPVSRLQSVLGGSVHLGLSTGIGRGQKSKPSAARAPIKVHVCSHEAPLMGRACSLNGSVLNLGPHVQVLDSTECEVCA